MTFTSKKFGSGFIMRETTISLFQESVDVKRDGLAPFVIFLSAPLDVMGYAGMLSNFFIYFLHYNIMT